MEIELERTFLLKNLPVDLKNLKSAEVFDIYLPGSAAHPILRIRKKGGKIEITKKHPVDSNDYSRYGEETIPLSEDEFLELAGLQGKRVRKVRHYYQSGGNLAEIDVFEDDLKGLILVDFEFKTIEDKNNFIMPDFCLVEVTPDKMFTGGFLAGKKYSDIEAELGKYNYKKF